ncbi:MAG: Kdo hydroxylase family protein [Gammaproteobacteria bacterium]|jgi:hypothetical protein
MAGTYELTDFSDASHQAIQAALEQSRVVYFSDCPVELPTDADLKLLRTGLPGRLRTKNVSYHPESDSVPQFDAPPAIRERVEGILRSHGGRVADWLQTCLPDYVPGWTLGTTSFRSMEERGRDLKPRSSNERVHVDAGAYGATNGARILRFFVNLHETRERVWGTKGSFADCMRRYPELWDAANRGRPQIGLDKSLADRLYSGSVAALSRALPLARNIDSSPYDRAMRRIHNRMKESDGFRDNDGDYRTIHFPPMSAWMVFTDGISHSVLTGQYAFVTTVLVPLRNCRMPELAPFNVLAAHDAEALRPTSLQDR